jgi:PAS domain S-box-containing protein
MSLFASLNFIMGGIAIILHLQYKSKIDTYWVPLPIFIVLTSITIFTSEAIRTYEDLKFEQLVQLEANNLSRRTDLYCTSVFDSFDRVTEQWKNSKERTSAYFEIEAKSHVENFEELQCMAWVNTKGVVEWEYPHNVHDQLECIALLKDPVYAEAIKESIATHQPHISRLSKVVNNQLEFIYIAPLFTGHNLDGFFIYCISKDILFEKIFTPEEINQYHITVSEKDNTVYNNLTDKDNLFSKWTKICNTSIKNLLWRISISPNKILLHNKNSYLPQMAIIMGMATSLIICYTIFLFLQSKKSQIVLKNSEERLNLAVTGTSDGLWDWDHESNQLYCSPRFKEMLGYEEYEWRNEIEVFYNHLHPDDLERVKRALQDHAENHIPYNIEYQLRKKDNSYLWIHARGQAIWNEANLPIRMSGFITDISERKKVEKLKDEFISNVSHELRTPLTSIRGSLGLILSGTCGKIAEEVKSLIDIASQNCERLILIINDILDIQKMESGQITFDLKELDLKTFLEKSIQLNQGYGEKYNVKFILKDPIEEGELHADEDRLMQVLANLLSNAAKFSPSGERVEITTTLRKPSFIRIGITDFGSGIPKEFQPFVFNKFAQADSSTSRQKGGTGLGLNISKTIIEHLGGSITFQTSSKGTTFCVDLPFLPKKRSEKNKTSTLNLS